MSYFAIRMKRFMRPYVCFVVFLPHTILRVFDVRFLYIAYQNILFYYIFQSLMIFHLVFQNVLHPISRRLIGANS